MKINNFCKMRIKKSDNRTYSVVNGVIGKYIAAQNKLLESKGVNYRVGY